MDYQAGQDPAKFEYHFGLILAAITRCVERGDLPKVRDLVGLGLRHCKSVLLLNKDAKAHLNYVALLARYDAMLDHYDAMIYAPDHTGSGAYAERESRSDKRARADRELTRGLLDLVGDITVGLYEQNRWTWRKKGTAPDSDAGSLTLPDDGALSLQVD